MLLIVTGAGGFIGSRVAMLLLQDGHKVVGIDDMNDVYDVRLKEWRVGQLMNDPKFQFHRISILDSAAIQSLLRSLKTKPDAMINLAARAGVRSSVIDPWAYLDTNAVGTLNLLELCRNDNIKKFILASTSSLYGANNTLPFTEESRTDTPLSPYAASKKAAEAFCYTYHHLYGIDITIFRYFTIYGPAGRPDMSPLRFVQWINEGRPVKIYGDGSQSRDFTYVDDVAKGTILGIKPLGYEIINLGCDKAVVLMDMIRLLEERLGKKAILEYHPAQPTDMLTTRANIDKASKLLGWVPHVSFPEGMECLVRWYLENRDWARYIRT